MKRPTVKDGTVDLNRQKGEKEGSREDTLRPIRISQNTCKVEEGATGREERKGENRACRETKNISRGSKEEDFERRTGCDVDRFTRYAEAGIKRRYLVSNTGKI